MANFLKKHDFSLELGRLYTGGAYDAFDLIHFHAADENGEDGKAAFESPDHWSNVAAETLCDEAACASIPATTRAIEENTLPSWLWRRIGEGKERTVESSAKAIFQRVAGMAAYAGWKLGVFSGEEEAKSFFDESRYLLAQRMIAVTPRALADPGLDWAYGLIKKPARSAVAKTAPAFENLKNDAAGETAIRNASIDALVGGDENARRKWRHFLATGLKNGSVTVRFADTAAEWSASASEARPVRAAIDLLHFRGEDGRLDIVRLRHAVNLLVILLDLAGLGGENGFAVGIANLAPFLLALALPYDSSAGRTTAAAIAAIVSAEVCAASARLAALCGPAASFTAYRESTLRSLRNHRRAAYGDRSDYEKISVLPAPLIIDKGADLALVAAARRGWDEALELARQHGLRHGHTTLFAAPSLAVFMESAAQGGEALAALSVLRGEADTYRRDIHPAVGAGLAKLGYDADSRRAIVAHIAGAGTLAGAPGVDHAALRARGFDDEAIAQVEHYLPYAGNLRLAFTPAVVGEDFCRDVLKIPAAKLRDPRFELLRHLGFSPEAIHGANAFCYGHGSARNAPRLKLEHTGIFALAHEMPAAAAIRMATALQSFVGGDAGLRLARPAGIGIEDCENLILGAWRQGAKSIRIEIAPVDAPRPARNAAQRPAKTAPAIALPGGGRLRSALKSRSKASSKLVGLRAPEAKTPATTGKKS
ncbi:MAG TPA: hypothetical protein VMV79_05045 [Alphaproteobacteria bacterium]|nr:hypothetical protein [Alphaproteobacteria bacterium]